MLSGGIGGGEETFGTGASSYLGQAPGDDVVRQIREDAQGRSILEVLKGYMDALKGELDNDALPYRKLARLFALGGTPEGLGGHHYGVALGLRTGDLHGVAAEHGNLLGYIWGTVVGGVTPWVGKTFAPMAPDDRQRVIGTTLPDVLPVSRGINHFHVIDKAPVNVALNAVLTFMWHLADAPKIERETYGNQKDGGHFAAYRAPSIYDRTPREVLRLNYRYAGLQNHPPLTYLIDELVQIDDGLYLGQVLFATDRLLERYDPLAKNEIYRYQHFGYFILFSHKWNAGARDLFPQLGMPEAALQAPDGTSAPAVAAMPAKLKTLTLADPPDGDVDPAILEQVRRELDGSPTLLHLLKGYSDALGASADTRSLEFAKLHTLFNAGIGPRSMSGFTRGARLTFQSQGFLAAFNVNTLNIAWQALRFFTPWTGKRFDPIERDRLLELTEGVEKGDVPTAFGSNTVVFRSVKQKVIEGAMRLARVWMEEASEDERRRHGYDARCYFFIGKSAPSIVPENKGKLVYQFNYRWKALKTLPPDNFCIDEISQIAEGLYLGKLIYSTELFKPWDPRRDPKDYTYRLFGYFLLMDEDWHTLRLRIGLDPDDV